MTGQPPDELGAVLDGLVRARTEAARLSDIWGAGWRRERALGLPAEAKKTSA